MTLWCEVILMRLRKEVREIKISFYLHKPRKKRRSQLHVSLQVSESSSRMQRSEDQHCKLNTVNFQIPGKWEISWWTSLSQPELLGLQITEIHQIACGWKKKDDSVTQSLRLGFRFGLGLGLGFGLGLGSVKLQHLWAFPSQLLTFLIRSTGGVWR